MRPLALQAAEITELTYLGANTARDNGSAATHPATRLGEQDQTIPSKGTGRCK